MSRHFPLGLALSLITLMGCDVGYSGPISPLEPNGSAQPASVRIHGTVRSWDDSTPVAGVRLAVVQIAAPNQPDIPLVSVTSDTYGRYSMTLTMDCSTGWNAEDYGLAPEYPYWASSATGTLRPLTKQVCQSDFRLDICVKNNEGIAPT
jgi:hypothetical protein